MSFRISIGCCNRLFAEATASLFQDEKDCHIVGIFGGSPDFTVYSEQMLQSSPDVFISDFATFNGNINRFLALCDKCNETRLKILLIGGMVSRFGNDHSLNEFIMQGVLSILPAGADSATLKQAIRSIVSGDLWIDRATLMKIVASVKTPGKSYYLAKREREIVLHICQGYRNKEIAQKLKISEQTVKSYCHKIYKKLGVSDRLQLVLQAHNIIPGYTNSL
jgi:DNA-binding NarL/FixJ family response regulator